MFKTWCKVNQVPFNGYDETSLEAFEKMLPPELGQEMGEMFLYFDEFGYTGGEEGVVLAQDVSPVQMETSLDAALTYELQARGAVPIEHVGGVYKVGGRVGRCTLSSNLSGWVTCSTTVFFTGGRLIIPAANLAMQERGYEKNPWKKVVIFRKKNEYPTS